MVEELVAPTVVEVGGEIELLVVVGATAAL